MDNFFDSNILVAPSVPNHPHHAACHARLAKLRATGGACSSHSLAETYGNLTHVSRYGLPPAAAMSIIDDASEIFSIVTLSAREYTRALHAAADMDLRGSIIYDALILACARKIDAKKIYRYNVKHFRRIAPDLAHIIIEP